jgi:hypothetical protein
MHSLLSRQAFEHEADHGGSHEGDRGAGQGRDLDKFLFDS